MGFKKFRKKARRFSKKAAKVARKTAKVVSKVSAIAGPILEEVGTLTGQPELIALGKGAEELSAGLNKGLKIEKKLSKAVKHKNPLEAIDAIGEAATALGIANPEQIELAKRRATGLANVGTALQSGNIEEALAMAGSEGLQEALHQGVLNKGTIKKTAKVLKRIGPLTSGSDDIDGIRKQLLQLLVNMDTVEDKIKNEEDVKKITKIVNPIKKTKNIVNGTIHIGLRKKELVAHAKSIGVKSSGTKQQILASINSK